MHSFRGKLHIVTLPSITFRAAKFQHQKKFWLRVNWPSGLSSGVLIRPAPLQLCALCIGAVRGVPKIRRLRRRGLVSDGTLVRCGRDGRHPSHDAFLWAGSHRCDLNSPETSHHAKNTPTGDLKIPLRFSRFEESNWFYFSNSAILRPYQALNLR